MAQLQRSLAQLLPGMVLAIVATASAALAAAAPTRDVIPFRYAWRFHYGPGPDDAPGPGNCAFPIDVSGQMCTNVEHSPNRFTVSAPHS